MAYRLWLRPNNKDSCHEICNMSLNQVDLLCLAQDAWDAAAPKGKGK